MSKPSRSKLHPSLLAGHDEEREVINNTGRGRVDRVMLNRGDNWIVRFLHPHMGDKDRWFARIAQHWLNKKPVFCPVSTAQWLGGDPKAYCPVCEAAENLRADRDEKINGIGFRLLAQLKWITYCLVLEKVTRSSEEIIELPEVLTVYEFPHYKNSFDELFGFVRTYRTAEWGIFDYEAGCDFGVTRTAKGIRLDRMQPSPILADFNLDDAMFDKYIKRIESQLKEPVVKMPSEDTLQEFAEKAYDEVDRLKDGGGGSRRRRSSRYEEDGDDDVDEPRGRRSSRYDDNGDRDVPPARRRASLDGDDEGDAPRARRSARHEESEPEAEAPSARRRRPSDDTQEESPRGRRRPSDDDPEDDPRERTSRRRSGSETEAVAEEPRSRRRLADDDGDGDADGDQENEAPRSGNRRRETAPAADPEADQDDVPMDYDKEGTAVEKDDAKVESKRAVDDRETETETEELPETPREGRRASTMQRRAFPETKGRSGRVSNSSLDEDEELPEENKDQAPPEREGDDGADAQDEPRGRSSVSNRISSRVSRASRRGE